MPQRTKIKRAELHTHLGSSVDSAILWSIAHRQGIRLPSKNYWDFESMITLSGNKKNRNIQELHDKFFYWTELIQSSPEAINEAVTGVIGGGYRNANIVLQELRFNPMFRNRGGEKDLDHIIMSSIWGVDRAILQYPQVKAGIILMMDRTLDYKENEIIVKKAIKYKDKGIIGVDIAGPQKKTFSMKKHATLFDKARKAGLGLTIHTGEEGTLDEIRFVVRKIKPDRIGHGIKCVSDKKLMADIVEQGIVLETCPTSNLKNSIVKNIPELRKIYKTLIDYKIKFTINTDGPEMYRTNIYKEQEFLRKNKILTQAQILKTNEWAFQASFIK